MAIASNSVFSEYPKPVLVGVGLCLTLLPILIVALRFLVRRRTPAGIGSDDWVILFALVSNPGRIQGFTVLKVLLVLCTGAGIVEILAAEIGGLGQHQRLGPQGELIHTSTLTNYEKCRYANEIITTLNLGVVKTSILLFYRRLFTVKPFLIASAIMIGFVAAWTISFGSAMAAQCVPARDFWNLFEKDNSPHCINVETMYQALAYSDLILDVMVLAFPVPMVVSLQLPWRKKIKIIDLFLLGSVVLGSGIARVVSFMQVVTMSNQNGSTFLKDTPWYTAGPLFWIFAENSIAIIGACLPPLAALRTFKRSSPSKDSSYYMKNWHGQKENEYNHLEGPYTRAGSAEDASVCHLVASGPATNIYASDIPLQGLPKPREGIQVDMTLSTDTKRMR